MSSIRIFFLALVITTIALVLAFSGVSMKIGIVIIIVCVGLIVAAVAGINKKKNIE